MRRTTEDSERRLQPRVCPQGHVKVRLLLPGQNESATLVDLNNAGAFVASTLVLDKGERLHVQLDLPGVEDTVPLEALVSRRSEEIQGKTKTIPAGLGLVFVGNTREERQLIQQVVMSILSLDRLCFGYEHQMRVRELAKANPREVDSPNSGALQR